MNQHDATLLANWPVIGKTITATAGTTEAELDLSTAAFTEETYPYLVGLQARDNQAYISAQGATGVALDTTAADNLLLLVGQTVYFVVRSASDAFIAHERSGNSDATLAATVMGRSVP